MRGSILLGSLVLALGAADARATTVSLGGDVTWVPDGAFDAFSRNDLMNRFDLAFAYTVADPGVLRLEVELGYGYAGELGAALAFAGLESSLEVHDLFAGVRAAVAPEGLDWLRPYVRVWGGASFGTASFTDPAAVGGGEYEDLAAAGLLWAGAGIEFALPWSMLSDTPPTPLTEPLALGLYLEGGYLYRSPLDFSPAQAGPDDPDEAADRIPTAGFSAGEVDLSGGQLRFGVIVRL